MMSLHYLAAVLLSAAAAQQVPPSSNASKPVSEATTVLEKIDRSGRCATVGRAPQQRLVKQPVIAPGAPPVLSFKLYEDAKHHRFGNVDVMLDDAGH
jgi:hypothetical protein